MNWKNLTLNYLMYVTKLRGPIMYSVSRVSDKVKYNPEYDIFR